MLKESNLFGNNDTVEEREVKIKRCILNVDPQMPYTLSEVVKKEKEGWNVDFVTSVLMPSGGLVTLKFDYHLSKRD